MRSRARRRPPAWSSRKRSCTGTTRRRCGSRRSWTSGAIGKLRLIRSAFTFQLTRTGDVRWEPALGGGSLWDVGCYPISIARLLAGVEPQEVFGRSRQGAEDVDEAFTGQLALGEVVAQFDAGFRAPLRTHLEVVGTEGVITAAAPFKPGPGRAAAVCRAVMRRRWWPWTSQPLYIGELDDLADAATLGREPRVTLADSRGNVADDRGAVRIGTHRTPRGGRAVTRPWPARSDCVTDISARCHRRAAWQSAASC